MLRTVFKLAVLSLLLVALSVAWLQFSPTPALGPPVRNPNRETAAELGEFVRWYRDDVGHDWVVTWGGRDGLSMSRADPPTHRSLQPLATDRFELSLESVANTELSVERGQEGDVLALVWADANAETRRATPLTEFPYNQREVSFRSGDIELSGLLLLPWKLGRLPGVVFIHGDGASDRNDYWYLYQADYLARQGVMVLLPDKRGCGRSGGDLLTADFETLAGDAIAGVEFLAGQPTIDRDAVGVVGITQGGWIAPLAASRSSAIRFVVNMSGSATTPKEQLAHQVSADMRSVGVPDSVAGVVEPWVEGRRVREQPVWWEQNGDFDPLVYWSQLDVPVLVVYGRLDEAALAPVERSLERLRGIAASADARWSFAVYDNLSHTMIDTSSGWISHDYLNLLVNWIETERKL